MIRKDSVPLWLWLNVLSLDAPIVALVWQDFLAHCYPSVLRVPGRIVLGLTVWAIYIADRLLDVRRDSPGNDTVRHRFYREHGAFAKVLLGLVVAVDTWIALTELRPAVFRNGLLIGLSVSIYLLLFSYWRKNGKYAKQISGSLLFVAGVFLVAWTGTEIPTASALAFFALCLGNLMLVESWEQGEPLSSAWVWLIALAVVSWFANDHPYFSAISASAFGLAILAIWGARTEAGELRGVLADAALLSPLLFR